LTTTPEEHGRIQIDQDPHGSFAVIVEELCVQLPPPRSHSPVDAANVVACGIGSNLAEFNSASAMRASMDSLQLADGGNARIERQEARLLA
jgi:hypothetical protein